MRRVVLVDPISTGHHISYAKILAGGLRKQDYELMAVGSPQMLEQIGEFLSDGIALPFDSRGNFLTRGAGKIMYIKKSVAFAQRAGADIIHFLYLDRFVLELVAAGAMGAQYRATLHWGYMLPDFANSVPKKLRATFELKALSLLCNRGLRVMVHSRWLQQSLTRRTGKPAFDFVPYPASLPPSSPKIGRIATLRSRLKLSDRDKLILVFGGTRYDKGADLAIKAMPLLDQHWHLLIAGKEEDFDKAKLLYMIYKHGVANRVHLYLRYIPDDEVVSLFAAADVVLLPYRKIFAGQSGPLVNAACLGIPVVAASVPVLAETIRLYRLGELFSPENIYEMSKAIKKVGTTPVKSKQADFCEAHSSRSFTEAVVRSYNMRV